MTLKYYSGILVVNGQNVDERLKAAKERREEQKKLLGMWHNSHGTVNALSSISNNINIHN